MRARSLFARQRGERLLLRNAKYVDLMCPLRPSDGSIIHVRILLSRRRSPCRRRRRTHLPAIAFSAREHYCAQDDFVDVAGIPSSFGSSPIESTPPTTLAAEALELFTFFPTHHALVSVTNERREPFERTRRVTVSFSDPCNLYSVCAQSLPFPTKTILNLCPDGTDLAYS